MLAVIILILRIVLLLALLSFVGWAFFTLWRDLKFQSQSLISQKIPYISISREHDTAENKQVFTIPELRIGRDPTCEIQLDDETVSNQHARLWFRNKQWWIEDLMSTNGTFLNDEKVETPTILISGDEIRVGKVLLIIEIQP
ncbi:MAG: FHA domain-containing protein [Anaerolineaceae bacterium]|nr:FHA domain-containing protein [Anaerolineaceae bacterium]